MRVTFLKINRGYVKPSGLVGTGKSPLPEALPQVRGIELLRSSWWTAFNKNNNNKIPCTTLFERHHLHLLKVIELLATRCVHGYQAVRFSSNPTSRQRHCALEKPSKFPKTMVSWSACLKKRWGRLAPGSGSSFTYAVTRLVLRII